MKNILPSEIPIFPLSNFIIFPRTNVPLNIFEKRYLNMVDDCMKNNRIIGMVQPKNKGAKKKGSKKKALKRTPMRKQLSRPCNLKQTCKNEAGHIGLMLMWCEK